jgi:acetyltransferase-like isoleucine patch superfamily enzyme
MQTILTSAANHSSDLTSADRVYTLLRENLLAGLHCSLGLDVTVAGTVMLEECVTIYKSTGLYGPLYIESDVQIGEYSQVGSSKLHPEQNELGVQQFTWIHNGVRIGHHTQIDSGVVLGQGAWLEPFSRVDCDVPAGVQAGGSPLILRGYLCSQCGSLLAPQSRDLWRPETDLCCSAGLRSGASPQPQQAELTGEQVQVICRVCGLSHFFASQRWRWVGRELPMGEPPGAGRLVEPAGLRRFMRW